MKIIKKQLIMVVVGLFVFLLNAAVCFADSDEVQFTNSFYDFDNAQLTSNPVNYSKQQLNNCIAFAEQCVEKYYMSTMYVEDKSAKLNGKSVNSLRTNINASDKMESYLAKKQAFDTINMTELDYEKKYLSGNFEVSDWKEIDGCLVFTVNAEVNFQYSDCEDSSSFGSPIKVIIENPNEPKLIDWYDCNDFFDCEVRGYDLDMYDTDNWIKNQNSENNLMKSASSMYYTKMVKYEPNNCNKKSKCEFFKSFIL